MPLTIERCQELYSDGELAKDVALRAQAATEAGRLGKVISEDVGAKATELLLGWLSDPAAEVREAVAIALGSVTQWPETVIEALRARCLTDENGEVRSAAVESLEKLGAASEGNEAATPEASLEELGIARPPAGQGGPDSASFECELSELSEPCDAEAATGVAKAAAARQAEGRALWLESFWFHSQERKGGVQLARAGRTGVRVQQTGKPSEQQVSALSEAAAESEAHWRKQIANALKKVEVEDLGNMNAADLLASIPEEDAAGRGKQDLQRIEKELSVKVCFCDDSHVLLVGAKAKLQKKCFAIRNLLSHYHWRLSGRDVAFEAMTAK